MRILFLHGWQSVPGGVKPTFLVRHGQEVINPKLPDADFAGAVQIAQAEFDRQRPDVIVGSSRGGAVALNMETGAVPLVLLCPAWKKYGTATTAKKNTTILHSRADDVVPFGDSEELVRNSRLPATALVEVGNDHRLADQEPLLAMLKACEKAAAANGSRMDPKVVKRLERALEKAIIEVICRLGLRKLPLLPAHRTMTMMAKAAAAVYQEAVDGPKDATTKNQGQE
jgi:hypothetical protein